MGRHEDHAAEDGGISRGVSLPIDGHGPEGVRKVAETLASGRHGGNHPRDIRNYVVQYSSSRY